MLWVSRRSVLAFWGACLVSACGISTQGTGAQNGARGGQSGTAGTSAGASGGTSAGTGGGTSAGTGGASGADGSVIKGPENCVDGQDNDGNGLTDCADPACKSGYECDPAAPAGWQGYYRLFEQDLASAAEPSPCPDGSAPTRLYTRPLPGTCSPCSCGSLMGGRCGAAQISCSTSSTTCVGETDWSSDIPDGSQCYKNGTPGTLSCESKAPPVAAGSCPPSGGTPTNSPALFQGVVDVCGNSRAGGGCGSGQACVARATGVYTGYLCIRKAGNDSCPAGWGTQPIAGYTGGTDQRNCTACQCTPPASCSPGVYTFYDADGCGGSTIDVGGSCTNVTSLMDHGTWGAMLSAAPAISGSCTPSGGQPTGGVVGQNPVTFCCQQL